MWKLLLRLDSLSVFNEHGTGFCDVKISHSWSSRLTRALPQSACAHCFVEGENLHTTAYCHAQ